MEDPSILRARRKQILRRRSGFIIERLSAAAYGRHRQDAITLSQPHGTKSFDDSYQSMTLLNQQGSHIYPSTMVDRMRMPIIGATPVVPHRR
jgi:hypothetical protein